MKTPSRVSQKFTLLREEEVAELKARGLMYKHLKTGAEVLVLSNEDSNKVFCVAFATPPQNSSGVEHIMEHSVLCGSKNFPVKEPFVELLKGSLYTFLNALTWNDFTAYPLANINDKDFLNMARVYFDAVFLPILSRDVFDRQAWHLEAGHKDSTKLCYSGVVFNEMKANYTDPMALFSNAVAQELFPDTYLKYDSGGDPREIPSLSYEGFIEFHKRHYNASNARLYFYGNGSVEAELMLADEYLSKFEKDQGIYPEVHQQPFSAPRVITRDYPASSAIPPEKGAFIGINWALPASADLDLLFQLSFLNTVLLGNDGSPLHKALMGSRLGDGIIGGGLHSYIPRMYFSIGLQGTHAENAKEIEEIVLSTMQKLSQGIPSSEIEASLNRFEFYLREQTTEPHRGMNALWTSMASWMHGGDPLKAQAFQSRLLDLKTRLKAGEPLVENLIKSHFLDNPHRTTVLLKPNPDLKASWDAEEQERLSTIQKSLSPKDLHNIQTRAEHLQATANLPDTPEALQTIPRLQISDLARTGEEVPTVIPKNASHIQFHDLFTNGIVYLDLGLDYSNVPRALFPYLTPYTRILFGMGTKNSSYDNFANRIARETGGISAWPYAAKVRGAEEFAFRFILQGKVLASDVKQLLAIYREGLVDGNLDSKERFLEIVREQKGWMEQGIQPHGIGFAMDRARAHFHVLDELGQEISGINYLGFLRDLESRAASNWAAVLNQLHEFRENVVNSSGIRLNVACEAHLWDTLTAEIEGFVATLPNSQRAPATRLTRNLNLPDMEGFSIPSQVNYVGLAVNLFDSGYKYHGSMDVLLNILRTSWLWNEIRIKGGAYGFRSFFERETGLFALGSYRDPHIVRTIDVFRNLGDTLASLPISDSDIKAGIIASIRNLDHPLSPQSKSLRAFVDHLCNRKEQDRKRTRAEVFATTENNLRDLSPIFKAALSKAKVAVIGGKEQLEEANRSLKGALSISQLL